MEIDDVKNRMVRICRAMLRKDLDLLAGCYMLYPLCKFYDANDNHEIYTYIVVTEEVIKLCDFRFVDQKLYHANAVSQENAIKILREYAPHITQACRITYDKLISPHLRAKYGLVEDAKDLLEGKVEFWEGCGHISAARHDLDPPYCEDPVLLWFYSIIDDVNKYPSNQSRCDPVYWKNKQQQLSHFKADIEQDVYDSCKAIIEKYSEPSIE